MRKQTNKWQKDTIHIVKVVIKDETKGNGNITNSHIHG